MGCPRRKPSMVVVYFGVAVRNESLHHTHAQFVSFRVIVPHFTHRYMYVCICVHGPYMHMCMLICIQLCTCACICLCGTYTYVLVSSCFYTNTPMPQHTYCTCAGICMCAFRLGWPECKSSMILFLFFGGELGDHISIAMSQALLRQISKSCFSLSWDAGVSSLNSKQSYVIQWFPRDEGVPNGSRPNPALGTAESLRGRLGQLLVRHEGFNFQDPTSPTSSTTASLELYVNFNGQKTTIFTI